METSEPKWVNLVLNISEVNSLRLGGLHIKFSFNINYSNQNYLWFDWNNFLYNMVRIRNKGIQINKYKHFLNIKFVIQLFIDVLCRKHQKFNLKNFRKKFGWFLIKFLSKKIQIASEICYPVRLSEWILYLTKPQDKFYVLRIMYFFLFELYFHLINLVTKNHI